MAVFFEEPGLRKTQNSIHPFVCFSASCPFCPRGHWLTVCISRCIKTYCTHRIDSEVIADLRFSASKISRLPPKILVPATLVPLPQFRDVICVALLMQRTCNTHATHMQHTCNTTCNTSLFLGNFQEKCPRGWKSTFSILRLGLSWKRQILHVDCKFTGKMLVLHVVLHVCCMCVACVLHVRCMSRATQITSLNWGSGTSVAGTRILGGRGEILEAENLQICNNFWINSVRAICFNAPGNA